jgi:2-polyprenyl-6-methoxyphenol hydroxylase-like FAD-dependent oxidoreductase
MYLRKMDTKHYDIIIAGAGPTGLMLAGQLARAGVDCLVIDKKEGPTRESRALVVQARSLEIYDQMGLSTEVVKDGQQGEGILLYKKGKKVAGFFFGNLGETLSPFPYVLIYEQSKNEALLYGYLKKTGRDVQWNTELTAIHREEGRYALEAGGKRYSCTYLLACDGAGSKVREWTGVAFTGGTYEHVFYVADTHIRGGGPPKDKLSFFMGRKEFVLVFPLPGRERFRVLGLLPKTFYHRDDIRFEEVEANAKKGMDLPLDFYDTNWYSTYRLHHKKVDHFRDGNVFFVGDAGHVHSPAGGQGMNTGLQDAYNLAWKLALVVKGKAGEGLLDTYHEERNPVAEELLKSTDRAFEFMAGEGRLSQFLRLSLIPRLLPVITRFTAVRRAMFKLVSQIRIRYVSSSLSLGRAGAIKAGERFPYYDDIYTWINQRQVTPFLVLVHGLPVFEGLDQELFTVVSLETVGPGFPPAFVVVLRPDNYIAYVSEFVRVEEMRAFFRRFGLAP